MNDGLLQIGEAAERAGLSLRTVRYYEEMGLLEPAKRTDGGFRLYTSEHVDRLALIKRMKPIGFTVQQMRELLDARDILRATDATVDARKTARASLTEFAALAAAACDDMRAKVARGDEFVRQLRRESRS
jgi:DNA-binding transcriptional MerR regulator